VVSPDLSVRPRILAAKLIPAPHEELRRSFGALRNDQSSFGLIACDLDHALHVALDEATKASPVTVLYVRSLYAGAASAPGPFSGEAIGILAGADDDIVREGLKAATHMLDNRVAYRTTTGPKPIVFFSHVVPSLGLHLSGESGLAPGDSMAYLMAPPIESVVALDAALKNADVRMIKSFLPPTVTNYGGAFLTGPLEECEAAARAFSTAIERIAEAPVDSMASYVFERRPLKALS
jgi:ethanolamine utilization protein EutL